ncbi:FCD domain-containing protein [Anderseniella sp. Alg231-50]|uniref:FCD domain-containing protein n=1 Tax=Anderseniella sp. Alg231-50 TaxID=1922226 RepID=UPI000D555BD2
MTDNTIVDALRADILSGELPPGAELHQAGIAERFGASRIPVRDALASLAGERLVTIRPNRGAWVVSLSPAEIGEVFELRLMLECNCVRAAAAAASPEQVDEVRYQLRRSSLEAGRAGWSKGDRDFHEALYQPAAKPRHVRLIGELRNLCRIHAKGYDSLKAHTPRWLEDHEAIAAEFAAGHATACEKALRRHLSATRDVLLQAMSGS